MISDIKWDNKKYGGENLLMGSKEGKICEIRVPLKVDNSKTYQVEFEPRVWMMRMMESQKPKKEEMDLEFLLRRNKDEKIPEVEWEPQSIMNVAYYNDECTKVIASVDGKYLGYLYVIDWNKDRPLEGFVI